MKWLKEREVVYNKGNRLVGWHRSSFRKWYVTNVSSLDTMPMVVPVIFLQDHKYVNQEVRSPVDQVCDAVLNDNTHTIANNSVSNYTMGAHVFGSRASFSIDTGAAVSLISTEVWLNPISIRLVGVDGVPLQVKGSVNVELEMHGRTFCQELIVVNVLAIWRNFGVILSQSQWMCFKLASRNNVFSRDQQ